MLPLDYVEFFVFLAALCVVGFLSGPRRARQSSTDYFLAGRRLPWYAVGGSYVAANVSTEHFIGLVGASYILGMPPALAQWQTTIAEVVIVFLFVPFLIRAHVVTVPQYLAAALRPGRAAGLRAADHLRQCHHLHGGGDVCRRPGAVRLFRLAAVLVHRRHRHSLPAAGRSMAASTPWPGRACSPPSSRSAA